MKILNPYIGRILLLQLLYLFVRIAFYANNKHLFAELPPLDVVNSFIIGMRFDLAAICLLNSLYFLLSLIPAGSFKKAKHLILGIWFTLSNGLFLSFNIFDLEYFQYQGKRLTVSSFLIMNDIQDQIVQVSLNYWYFSLGMIFCYYLLWVSQKAFDRTSYIKVSLSKRAMLILPALAFLVLLARGGMQVKPLVPAHAYLDNRPQLANLSLNTTFTILKSYKQKPLPAKNYYPTWPKVRNVMAQVPTLANPKQPVLKEKTNVVLIILESFNLEYMGHDNDWEGYTPFLDELSEKSHFFPYHLANGRRSIDAMPSIFAGLPSWMPRPFITSNFQGNRLAPLPQKFRDAGYSTAFFHGGENGTMFFDVMAQRFGFDQYYGAQEYPDSSQHDGHWGIFDEPFLQYTVETINKMEKPFFSSVFTLSSHQPYSIPEQHQGKFKKGTLAIHESIGYSDYALRQFFESAKKQDWYKDTLFIITSDHTSISEHADFQTQVGNYRVPLIFFHPSRDLPLETQQLAQQTDILPTLIDLFGLSNDNISHFGRSLLLGDDRHVIFSLGQQYFLLSSQGLMSFDSSGKVKDLQILPWLPPAQEEKSPNWNEILRAKVQYYHNGLLEDHLVW